MNEPVYQFVRGRDQPWGRLMRNEEAAKLTDWFGAFLRRTPRTLRPYHLEALLAAVPARTWRPFAICDGIFIPFDPTNTKTVVNGPTKLNNIPRALRFVITCVPDDPDPDVTLKSKSKIGNFLGKGGMCIVASANTSSNEFFLQIASWDADAQAKGLGYIRFYQVRGAILRHHLVSEFLFSELPATNLQRGSQNGYTQEIPGTP